MLSKNNLIEIFRGAKVYYNENREFIAGPGTGKICIWEALEYHMGVKVSYNSFTITKIELTKENKRKLYEYLGSL